MKSQHMAPNSVRRYQAAPMLSKGMPFILAVNQNCPDPQVYRGLRIGGPGREGCLPICRTDEPAMLGEPDSYPSSLLPAPRPRFCPHGAREGPASSSPFLLRACRPKAPGLAVRKAEGAAAWAWGALAGGGCLGAEGPATPTAPLPPLQSGSELLSKLQSRQ